MTNDEKNLRRRQMRAVRPFLAEMAGRADALVRGMYALERHYEREGSFAPAIRRMGLSFADGTARAVAFHEGLIRDYALQVTRSGIVSLYSFVGKHSVDSVPRRATPLASFPVDKAGDKDAASSILASIAESGITDGDEIVESAAALKPMLAAISDNVEKVAALIETEAPKESTPKAPKDVLKHATTWVEDALKTHEELLPYLGIAKNILLRGGMLPFAWNKLGGTATGQPRLEAVSTEKVGVYAIGVSLSPTRIDVFAVEPGGVRFGLTGIHTHSEQYSAVERVAVEVEAARESVGLKPDGVLFALADCLAVLRGREEELRRVFGVAGAEVVSSGRGCFFS